MGYNTRRKSLSLPSLGIQLPQTTAARRLSASPAKSDLPLQKKVKREYSPPAALSRQDRYGSNLPPSPPPENRISREGINDDIVSGVVDVLERTGNRPHTVKELAAELAGVVNIVENSANPHAIISSRLNSFLKRDKTPSTPCIIAKQLITTHPRRIYFYLTTCPHQPIPKHENDNISTRRSVVSPALSDDEDNRRRIEMSPSPEIDLGLHDESDNESSEETSGTLSTSRASIIERERTTSPASLDNKSALSTPVLEGDEREFSQSAIFIVRRSASREIDQNKESDKKRSRGEYEADVSEDRHIESSTNDAAAMLLGYGTSAPAVPVPTSPMVVPTQITTITPNIKVEGAIGVDAAQNHNRDQEKPNSATDSVLGLGLGNWGGELERHLGSPESVELDELDDLLDF
ncbi:hypothetical protein DFP73DRAFT_250807 [Morchella snyderi]|nr:hypothetical protein DFP73DRAFT_250807 [Morchella snyderi]